MATVIKEVITEYVREQVQSLGLTVTATHAGSTYCITVSSDQQDLLGEPVGALAEVRIWRGKLKLQLTGYGPDRQRGVVRLKAELAEGDCLERLAQELRQLQAAPTAEHTAWCMQRLREVYDGHESRYQELQDLRATHQCLETELERLQRDRRRLQEEHKQLKQEHQQLQQDKPAPPRPAEAPDWSTLMLGVLLGVGLTVLLAVGYCAYLEQRL